MKICVEDTGIGIEPEYHDKIFDRFFQVESDAHRRYSGIGIGLATVKEIVEAHGREVWFSSKVGEGSRFCFTIPEARKEHYAVA